MATVSPLMAELGIAGASGRAKTITTRPDRHGRKSVDLVKDNFTVHEVDTLLSKRSHLYRNQRGVALPGMHHGCLIEENSWPCDGENNDTELFVNAFNQAKDLRGRVLLRECQWPCQPACSRTPKLRGDGHQFCTGVGVT
jgi:hypothetical protein